MYHRNIISNKPRQSGNFWRSRIGVALMIFIVIGGFLLIYEHRVHIVFGNAFLIALLAICVGAYFFVQIRYGAEDSTEGDKK